MKKGILLYLILMVEPWRDAQENSDEGLTATGDDSSTMGDSELHASATTIVSNDEGIPESAPSIPEANNPDPAPVAPAAPAPATPANPPAPVAIDIETLHAKYAAILNIPVDDVRKTWNSRMGSAKPEEVARNIEFLNGFFGFVFDADKYVRLDMGLVKYYSDRVHQDLAGDKTALPNLLSSLELMRINSHDAHVQILQAAKIYGVDLNEVTDINREATLSEGLVLPMLSVIRYIQTKGQVSTTEQDKERVQIAVSLKGIFHDITFSYTNASGNVDYVSCVNFLNVNPILFAPTFSFGINQGGYGFVEAALVRFVY